MSPFGPAILTHLADDSSRTQQFLINSFALICRSKWTLTSLSLSLTYALGGEDGTTDQPNQVTITMSTPLQYVSVLDILQYQGLNDGDYRRTTGAGPINLVTINLGYIDPKDRVIVKTLGPDFLRELPLLNRIYSYDLNLADFYSQCGQSYLNKLNLQVQNCANQIFPKDASFLPNLPFMCHTPYYNATKPDFVDGQSPVLTRLHILDWRLNMTFDALNITYDNTGNFTVSDYTYTAETRQVRQYVNRFEKLSWAGKDLRSHEA